MTATRTKGHWPKNKRRNPDGGQWSRIRLLLTQLVTDHPKRGVISRQALAHEVGVHERSVRRWLAGIDVPPRDIQLAVRTWCSARLDDVRDQEKRDRRASTL